MAAFVVALILAACQPTAQEPSPTAPSLPQDGPATASASASATEGTSPGPVIGEGEEWIVLQGVELGLTFIRPDGTGNHVILGPPGDQLHPDWSPDGSEVAYVQAGEGPSEIWITDLQGASPEPLLADVPAELAGLYWDNPAWSPDGSQIVAVAYEGDPQASLPARSVLAMVEVASGEVAMVGELASADGSLHSFPRWSPDGDALVVSLDQFDGGDFLGGRVAIVRKTDADWSAPDPITEIISGGPRVDWHPSEDLIVFCDNDVGSVQVTDDPSNLFTIRPDGSELTQITDFGPGDDRATQPSWTSDGRIIYTHITGADDSQLMVAFMNADGSGHEEAIGTDAVGIGNRPHPRLRPAP